MDLIDTDRHGGFFDVVAGTDRSQAATMVLDPGQSTGGPDTAHADSDQWLFVHPGSGVAVIEGDHHDVASGDLLLVEPGEPHEIRNDDDEPVVTVTVYAPPEY